MEVPRGLAGTIYTKSNSGFMETPCFSNGRFSLRHADRWWIGPMWPKYAFGDQKGLLCFVLLPISMTPTLHTPQLHQITHFFGLHQSSMFFVHLPLVSLRFHLPPVQCGFTSPLFSLQLSVCLWWHECCWDDFPTLKFVVVIADQLVIC